MRVYRSKSRSLDLPARRGFTNFGGGEESKSVKTEHDLVSLFHVHVKSDPAKVSVLSRRMSYEFAICSGSGSVKSGFENVCNGKALKGAPITHEAQLFSLGSWHDCSGWG